MKPEKIVSRRLLLAALAVVAPLLNAQDHGSISGNPYPTPQDAEVGAASFRTRCASCHGLDAAGGSAAPTLVSGTFRNGGSDEALFGTITRGVPGTAMLAFNIPGRETWQIITYLRSLNILRAAEKASGDPAKGAALFDANRCSACHSVRTKGGLTGPDLTDIGLQRSLSELETAVIDPDAEVFAEYWSIRARSRSGEAIFGIRMNEDMDSIQIREASGRLRSLWKSDLANVELVRKSPMPSFKEKLTANELQDLVAYLASLRGSPESVEAIK